LSRIDVAPGEQVGKGRIIGLTGATGIALGDHLHFEILVSGISADPEEWLDPEWSSALNGILLQVR
jgi:murein DD-endopeptidase MepM/ murein hydrolase activator NlpD